MKGLGHLRRGELERGGHVVGLDLKDGPLLALNIRVFMDSRWIMGTEVCLSGWVSPWGLVAEWVLVSLVVVLPLASITTWPRLG